MGYYYVVICILFTIWTYLQFIRIHSLFTLLPKSKMKST